MDDSLYEKTQITKISIGNYIINNGDLAAIAIINAVIRYNNNIINQKNILNETFCNKKFCKNNYVSNNKTSNTNNLNRNYKLKNNFSLKETSFYKPNLIKYN